jgi:hypothetical protein
MELFSAYRIDEKQTGKRVMGYAYVKGGRTGEEEREKGKTRDASDDGTHTAHAQNGLLSTAWPHAIIYNP